MSCANMSRERHFLRKRKIGEVSASDQSPAMLPPLPPKMWKSFEMLTVLAAASLESLPMSFFSWDRWFIYTLLTALPKPRG